MAPPRDPFSKKSPDLDNLVAGYKERMSMRSKQQNQKEALGLLQQVLDQIAYQHASDYLHEDPSKMQQLLSYTEAPDESLPINFKDLADLLIRESILEHPQWDTYANRKYGPKRRRRPKKKRGKKNKKNKKNKKKKAKGKGKHKPKPQAKQPPAAKQPAEAKQEYNNYIYNNYDDLHDNYNQFYDSLLSDDYSTQKDIYSDGNMNNYNDYTTGNSFQHIGLDISILIIITIGLMCLCIGFVFGCIIHAFVNNRNKNIQSTLSTSNHTDDNHTDTDTDIDQSNLI